MTYTLTEISCNGSQIFIMCVVGVWRCVGLETTVVSSPAQRAHTHTHTHTHMPPNTDQTHTIIFVKHYKQFQSKYSSSLPDDGSFVIRNRLE